MTKTKILDENIRAQIKDFLKRALTHTMESYDDYTQGRMTEDEKKDFIEKHKTAKFAISHFETLLELAEAADIPDKEGDGMELAMLLQQASVELDKYKERKNDE